MVVRGTLKERQGKREKLSQPPLSFGIQAQLAQAPVASFEGLKFLYT